MGSFGQVHQDEVGLLMNPVMIPAATLVLMREAGGDAPELLMIERAADMSFAAGALVFPGGRIDPGDRAIAADPALLAPGHALDPDDAAARVAAIRETIEEVGIAPGLDPAPDPAAIVHLRAALAEGGDFAALLAAAGYLLDLGRLTLFARWRPNLSQTRNFDTRFYLAVAPDDAAAEADGGESVHAAWLTASKALADADARTRRIIFPTRRNLERLAGWASHADGVADAARYPVEPITPWMEDVDGEKWLCIPEGSGYPITRQRAAEVPRG